MSSLQDSQTTVSKYGSAPAPPWIIPSFQDLHTLLGNFSSYRNKNTDHHFGQSVFYNFSFFTFHLQNILRNHCLYLFCRDITIETANQLACVDIVNLIANISKRGNDMRRENNGLVP